MDEEVSPWWDLPLWRKSVFFLPGRIRIKPSKAASAFWTFGARRPLDGARSKVQGVPRDPGFWPRRVSGSIWAASTCRSRTLGHPVGASRLTFCVNVPDQVVVFTYVHNIYILYYIIHIQYIQYITNRAFANIGALYIHSPSH
jgi:hypothetical protein